MPPRTANAASTLGVLRSWPRMPFVPTPAPPNMPTGQVTATGTPALCSSAAEARLEPVRSGSVGSAGSRSRGEMITIESVAAISSGSSHAEVGFTSTQPTPSSSAIESAERIASTSDAEPVRPPPNGLKPPLASDSQSFDLPFSTSRIFSVPAGAFGALACGSSAFLAKNSASARWCSFACLTRSRNFSRSCAESWPLMPSTVPSCSTMSSTLP